MNRRGFLGGILKAGIGAMILPSALTYTRNWSKPYGNLIWYSEASESLILRHRFEEFKMLPYYVNLQVYNISNFQAFETLYGKLDWQPNMGNVLRAV